MRTRPFASSKSVHLAILRSSAQLVPITRRADWLQEWTSELWYVQQACLPPSGQSWQGEKEVAAFCLGAFKDALCLRQAAPRRRRKLQPLQSATQCLGSLTLLAIAAFCLSLLLPGAHTAMQPSPYRDPRNLILISGDRFSETSIPTIRAGQFRSWKNRTQHLFTGFAFYQTTVKSLHIAPHAFPELSIARSSSNLFDLLGLPIQYSAPTQAPNPTQPTLILSERAWRTWFNADPHTIGREFKLGLRPVKVAGILPDASWRLPGNFDAWLLEPDDRASAIASNVRGYVVARQITSPDQTSPGRGWRMSVLNPDRSSQGFDCEPLSSRLNQHFNTFLFTVFLALLALPATTSLPLGEYPDSPQNLSWSIKLRRWLFLAGKIALILPIVYIGSLDLAHLSPSIALSTSQLIQGISSFSACLFAFRWTLRDQRKRCPVCLRLLTNPARVGQPSRTFLAFNGTELICSGGHGLLHVPEISTSWYSTQRWLYLDPSWKSLFSDPHLASAGMF
jgi:hypothetical protein